MAVSAEHGQLLKTDLRVVVSSKIKDDIIGGVEESEDATPAQDSIEDFPRVMDIEDGFDDDAPDEV